MKQAVQYKDKLVSGNLSGKLTEFGNKSKNN